MKDCPQPPATGRKRLAGGAKTASPSARQTFFTLKSAVTLKQTTQTAFFRGLDKFMAMKIAKHSTI
jgi:hypothetical protein